MSGPDETAQTEKEPRKGFLRRWYDRYDFAETWYERINQAQEWGQYLLTLLKTKAASTAAVATVAGGAAVGTVAVVKPELFEGLFQKQPVEVREVEVTASRWGEAAVFPVSGRDAQGASADFFVIVLPKEYTWARRSSDQITRNGEALSEEEIAVRIFAAEMRSGLAAALDVMAVGVASQEGNVAAESSRAAERARTAALWLERHGGSPAAIWRLNLGQFRDACAAKDRGDTSWQRPLLFVSVRRKDDGVDLSDALANAIAGKSNLPSRECYSNFDLTRHP